MSEIPEFKRGTVIRGFGHGAFGRDSYNTKTCIKTGFYAGERWALFHEEGLYGRFHVLSGERLAQVEEWEHNDPSTDGEE